MNDIYLEYILKKKKTGGQKAIIAVIIFAAIIVSLALLLLIFATATALSGTQFGSFSFSIGLVLTYGDVVVTSLSYDDGKVNVEVENNGADTCDVIELYIKSHCDNAPGYPVLCGFKRIFVKKGEKLDVEIEIPDKAFTTVSDIGERKQFAKEFTLYVGTHQPDELSCQLSGTNCMSIEIER